MSDFEVCPIGTLQRLARVEAFASALRQQAEQSAQRLAAVEAERDSMKEILDHIPQVEAELAETSDRLHAVEAERDALRVDAERYRCWRANFANDEPDDPNDLNPLLAALTDAWTEDEIDAAIDATIAEKGGGNG